MILQDMTNRSKKIAVVTECNSFVLFYTQENSSLLTKVHQLYAEDYEMMSRLHVDMSSWVCPPPSQYIHTSESNMEVGQFINYNAEAVVAHRAQEITRKEQKIKAREFIQAHSGK